MDESLDLNGVNWNDFKENTSNAFKSCYKDKYFADVTLASEDDKPTSSGPKLL